MLGLAFSCAFEMPPYVTVLGPFILLLSAIILISNLFTHNLYALCVKKYGLSLVQLGSLVAPMFGALITSLTSFHTPSFSVVLSTMVTLGGFYIFYKEESKKTYQFTTVHAKNAL